MSPDHPGWAMVTVQTLASTGQFELALDHIDQRATAPESHPLGRLTHVLGHALRGDSQAATELITPEFVDIMWIDWQYSHIMAQAYAVLRKKDEAFKWLERSVERGYINYPFLSERDTLLENLRQDPRFGELMERVRTQWEGFETAVGVK